MAKFWMSAADRASQLPTILDQGLTVLSIDAFPRWCPCSADDPALLM